MPCFSRIFCLLHIQSWQKLVILPSGDITFKNLAEGKGHLKMYFRVNDLWYFPNSIYAGGIGKGCLNCCDSWQFHCLLFWAESGSNCRVTLKPGSSTGLAELYNYTDCPGLGTQQRKKSQVTTSPIEAEGLLQVGTQGAKHRNCREMEHLNAIPVH